jgi:glycosyltransferase involved in cell wall biosynthesis
VSSRKNIVVYCVDTVGGGGTEVWVRSLIKSLSRNYTVRLVSNSLNSDLETSVTEFVRIPLPSKPGFLRIIIYVILSSLVSRRDEIVHVVGAITLRRSNLNTVHFYHRENWRNRKNSIFRNSSILKIINRSIYSSLAIFLERLIFNSRISIKLASVSPEMCELLTSDFRRKVYLTHNGVEPLELQSFEKIEENFYILFVGGDWERKGLADVIICFSKLLEISSKLKLKIAGEGDRKRFIKIAENLKINSSIEWLGRIDRVKIPYGPCGIVVCASNFEVSPLVFLEAAMLGSPVVSYPVFGTQEAFSDGYLRICPATPEGMFLTVSQLFDNPEQLKFMSNKGLEIRSKRNWSIAFLETEYLYKMDD